MVFQDHFSQILNDPGQFPLSQYYPANYVNTNRNATQKNAKTVRVFWNTNGPSTLK